MITRLFVDDGVIARKEGVVRRAHPCRNRSSRMPGCGWVSLDAGETPGTVETTPIPSEDGSLIVNAEAARGDLRAEILDPSGAPVPGYRLSDCPPVTGDGVRQTVCWKTRDALPISRGIRIRFRFSSASLYGFSITSPSPGSP